MNNQPRSEIPALSLSYLGVFKASLGETTLQKFSTSKVQALLIYLTTEAVMVKGTVTHFFLKPYKEDGEILEVGEKVRREPLTL